MPRVVNFLGGKLYREFEVSTVDGAHVLTAYSILYYDEIGQAHAAKKVALVGKPGPIPL